MTPKLISPIATVETMLFLRKLILKIKSIKYSENGNVGLPEYIGLFPDACSRMIRNTTMNMSPFKLKVR